MPGCQSLVTKKAGGDFGPHRHVHTACSRAAARALVGLPASWPMHFGYTDLQAKRQPRKDWRKC